MGTDPITSNRQSPGTVAPPTAVPTGSKDVSAVDDHLGSSVGPIVDQGTVGSYQQAGFAMAATAPSAEAMAIRTTFERARGQLLLRIDQRSQEALTLIDAVLAGNPDFDDPCKCTKAFYMAERAMMLVGADNSAFEALAAVSNVLDSRTAAAKKTGKSQAVTHWASQSKRLQETLGNATGLTERQLQELAFLGDIPATTSAEFLQRATAKLEELMAAQPATAATFAAAIDALRATMGGSSPLMLALDTLQDIARKKVSGETLNAHETLMWAVSELQADGFDMSRFRDSGLLEKLTSREGLDLESLPEDLRTMAQAFIKAMGQAVDLDGDGHFHLTDTLPPDQSDQIRALLDGMVAATTDPDLAAVFVALNDLVITTRKIGLINRLFGVSLADAIARLKTGAAKDDEKHKVPSADALDTTAEPALPDEQPSIVSALATRVLDRGTDGDTPSDPLTTPVKAKDPTALVVERLMALRREAEHYESLKQSFKDLDASRGAALERQTLRRVSLAEGR